MFMKGVFKDILKAFSFEVSKMCNKAKQFFYSIEASTNTEFYTDFNAIVKVSKSPEISFQQRSEGRF
jgi:hypothetical protein